jgi:hypothetical protein
MMMTSSMVMGSVLWMEGVGLGLARNIVQRYALKTGSEQGFGIGEKVAHDCVDRPDDAAFIECIISEQPPIMPRPIWPVLVPWSSLPAVPFCAKTGTIRPPRPAASMAMLVSDAHANSPLAVKRFPKAGSRPGRGTRLEKPSSSELPSLARSSLHVGAACGMRDLPIRATCVPSR